MRYADRRLVAVALIALAVEGWILLSDFHLLWKPQRVPTGAVRVAQVVSVSRQAKARSSLQLNWFDLSPGQDLYEGDEVATMDRSGASLKFVDGQTVTLEPNSFLVLRNTSLTGDPAFHITLVHGGLQQESTEGGASPRSRLEIDVGSRKIVAQGQASVKIESRDEGQPTIAVGGGKVSVTEIGTRALEIGRAGGPLVQASSFEVKAPLLKSPSSDAVLSNPGQVTLQWKKADLSGAPSLVEVSRDEAFKDVVWHAIFSDETRADFVPERKGRYFWRVTRLGADRKAVSAVASFEVRRSLLAPKLARPRVERGLARGHQHVDAPLLSRPIIHYQKESLQRPMRPLRRSWLTRVFWSALRTVDNLAFGSAYADEPVAETRYTVDLKWEPVAEATAYVLQIATDEDFKHIVADKLLTQTSFQWHTNNAGYYYWHVAGVDKEGDRGPFSEFNVFSIRVDRNRQGDESSYETYLRFDEYSKYTQNLRLLYGQVSSRYYFSGSDVPSSVIYHSRSYLDGQLNYDYRLSPYYSLQFTFREDKAQIGGSNYESRPDQETLSSYETVAGVGIERRFFFPRHYFVLQTGVRASFIDIPIDAGNGDGSLSLSDFGFIGAYGAAGIHELLGNYYDGSFALGVSYQTTGDAYRIAQYASIEVRRQLFEFLHVGLRLDEVLAAYRFNTDLLVGQSHMLSFRPGIFVDWSF